MVIMVITQNAGVLGKAVVVNITPSRLCWICETNRANSGEHRIKRSDLNRLYPRTSQKQPIYWRQGNRTKAPIGSNSSKKLHFAAKMCAYCNGALTQPYDAAWSALSEHLAAQPTSVRQIKLEDVFDTSPSEALVHVQLFFAKQMGCIVVENSIPIDLADTRRALLEAVFHPRLFLRIGFISSKQSRRSAILTPADGAESSGTTEALSWHYLIGCIYVGLVYLSHDVLRVAFPDYWSPPEVSDVLPIGRTF